jgi:Uncharacterized protein conserved in bacteria
MSLNLYIIAGCNGAGKTTASYTILPEILNCKEFVNADEIAKGLSPFQPESVAIEAGKIMLKRIDTLINEKEVFAFETTLSTLLYKNRIRIAKEKGYQIILVFFWLRDVNLAIERVKLRVKEGGHNIPVDVIERRYRNGIKNLFSIYLPIIDEAYFFDNSDNTPELIAEKNKSSIFDIKNFEKFNQLKSYAT